MLTLFPSPHNDHYTFSWSQADGLSPVRPRGPVVFVLRRLILLSIERQCACSSSSSLGMIRGSADTSFTPRNASAPGPRGPTTLSQKNRALVPRVPEIALLSSAILESITCTFHLLVWRGLRYSGATMSLALLCALVGALHFVAIARASEIDYKLSVKQLLANLEFSMGLFKDPNSVSPGVLKWDLLSNNEVHIMLKLIRYLRRLVKSPDATVANLIQGGFQCSALHPAQQEAISRQVEMSICSEVEWYKTAQLTFPEAKTIIDVGGNKGYLGSLFVSLWGGGGYGVSPTALSSVFIKDKVWVRNPYGFCRDGLNNGLPLHCPPHYVKEPAFQSRGVCLYKRQGVTVTSFDGSSFLCQTLNDVMRHNMTDPQVRAHRVWKYMHSAAGDKVGVVAFTKQSRESRPGFEGGKMKQAHTEGQTELVNVTTIDSYAEAHGLKVDLLKIDAEGADALVIRGALKTIYSTVGLVTFEGYGKGSLTETTISDFDAHGFSCYSTSLAGLFKWNGGCMRGSRKRATKGNIFCASR